MAAEVTAVVRDWAIVLGDFGFADVGRAETVDEDSALGAVDEERHRPASPQEIADHVRSGQGDSFFTAEGHGAFRRQLRLGGSRLRRSPLLARLRPNGRLFFFRRRTYLRPRTFLPAPAHVLAP